MSEEKAKGSNARPVVLVVDDVDDIRSLLHAWLEQRDCRVLEAEGGEKAVEMAARERPDLVFMDISMPGGDGLNATLRLREQEGLRDVPVVVLSANGTEYYRAAALAAGCNDYLVKPLDPAKLEAVLSRFLPTG